MSSWQTWRNDWRVSDVERDRAVAILRDGYIDGRLSPNEFDNRVTRALAAVTRADLSAALAGLVVAGGRSSRHATGETLAAGLIGLSPFILGPLGPMLGVAISPRGSWTRRQVAHQANFQLVALLVGMVVLGIAAKANLMIVTLPLIGMAWFAGTIMHAAKAFEGHEWTNPVLRLIPLKFFDDGNVNGGSADGGSFKGGRPRPPGSASLGR
ncbi:DUF1707 and DUF4870 domain-containing protein [Cutibacterium sp. WCA-380-WT-3A]|uniref:DUF1707 and DUF4870 domain-containing protein n=1 Tax=Cutibacterium porci TaxID=2605781 RepID=A0A7K0J5Q3_9ACTN|nr:DUF1707 domain-containing protein [Cutibacterium porci]MSS45271.1 DUF1707 and DUF4870 domain-containing protein [Cutibacterium porci]